MRYSIGITLLLALQLACALFLLYDISSSLFGLRIAPVNWQLYELFEIGATVALLLGVGLLTSLLRRSRRREAAAEESLRLASGAFMQVVGERFTEWDLTPAERDVALFCIKGCSTQEIAQLRQTSLGTVKAQTAAIYRKAGVSGRAQLLSLFIDDLMGDAVPEAFRTDETQAQSSPSDEMA